MNIHIENVNLQSTSGPNHFASKLITYMSKFGDSFDIQIDPDVRLCFIETSRQGFDHVPLFQRLDGIYFNVTQAYKVQNTNIQRTYEKADGVIFQSNFNKELITRYFGKHDNSIILHNGADMEFINNSKPLEASTLNKYENIWCCASSWRPHKRLSENIRYFLEHSSPLDCLVVCGEVDKEIIKDKRIFYVGNLNIKQLISLYKRSAYFIHLAWLDHCPNVVVDARASGCQIICSSTGGTKEIAGPDAIIIEEEAWDFKPLDLYNPPKLYFDKKLNNVHDISYNMGTVAQEYHNFMEKSQCRSR